MVLDIVIRIVDMGALFYLCRDFQNRIDVHKSQRHVNSDMNEKPTLVSPVGARSDFI